MAEALSRKKKIRAGHRATVTRTLGDIATILSSATPDRDRIARLKLTLNEKLETLNRFDSGLLNSQLKVWKMKFSNLMSIRRFTKH